MYGQWSRRITNWYQGHSITKILTSESAWSFFLNRDAFLGQWWRWWRNQVLHKHDLHAWKSEKANEVWKSSRVYLPYSSNKIEHCHHILQVANFQSERSLSLWPWDKLNKSKYWPVIVFRSMVCEMLTYVCSIIRLLWHPWRHVVHLCNSTDIV